LPAIPVLAVSARDGVEEVDAGGGVDVYEGALELENVPCRLKTGPLLVPLAPLGAGDTEAGDIEGANGLFEL